MYTIRILFFIFFLLLWQKREAVAEAISCTCTSSEKKFKEIEELFDQKEYEEINILLDKISIAKLPCRQRVLGYRLELYIALNKKDDIEITYKELQQAAPDKSCDVANMYYHYELGNYFFKIEKPDNAIDNYIISKEIAEKIKDTIAQIRNIQKMAFLFNKMDQPEKALEYDRLGLTLAHKLTNRELIVYIYSQMQAHYGKWYSITNNIKYIDSVKKIVQITLKLATQYRRKIEVAQSYSVLSTIASIEKDYRKALSFCDSGLLFLDRNKDFRQLFTLFTNKCDAYYELKDLRNATRFLDSASKYAMLEGNIFSISYVYERIYEFEKLKGNYTKALEYHEKFTTIRDSIRSIEKTERINALEQKYNKVQNEKTIKELSQAKEIASLRIKVLLTGVFLALLIILLIVIFHRQSVLRGKQENMEIEQRLNRARMNPHFFFNTLNSIQILTIQENKESNVARYLAKYAKIMRQTLESTYKEMLTIEEEVDYITNYLDLQKMRYVNKFEYSINIDDSIEPREVYIPCMIIQPFVENSIEHGFNKNTEDGKINISISLVENNILVEISDNSNSNISDKKSKQYPSRAMQIIKERLSLLNKKYKTDARFEIRKSDAETGTHIKIILPLITGE